MQTLTVALERGHRGGPDGDASLMLQILTLLANFSLKLKLSQSMFSFRQSINKSNAFVTRDLVTLTGKLIRLDARIITCSADHIVRILLRPWVDD